MMENQTPTAIFYLGKNICKNSRGCLVCVLVGGSTCKIRKLSLCVHASCTY